ncbi:hypothetical protein CROQUDRAFT_513150 [Cronartium quercuum f. sp. fusiforme G11]|uniref:RNase H type-1 domain-containing protein n=1 Tax=Cronartium quercuum f. sp. fusiforme G11 TaxID=708437 RepID=A0A9P6NNB1_9BASI|nr:hypothetical protein CROQUDRAFT_513150 [Cronartium quercuum f. sp. fusiforme G11]
MTLNLYWSPGQEGIPLNKKADVEARKAIEDSKEHIQLCVSLSSLKARARKNFGTRGAPLDRAPYATTGKKIADAFAKLEKGRAADIFQLRSGHSLLRHHLKRIRPHCGLTETTAHFLINCEAYAKARRRL